MGSQLIAYPKIIFVQSTTPSNIAVGMLWFNTSNNQTYASDGSGYNLVAPSTSETTKLLQEIALNVLINSASAAALYDYDDMFADIASDADGYDGTIDTGNTTATFDTDHYKNTSDLDLAIRDGGSTQATTSARGYNFTTQQAGVQISQVEVDPNCNSTQCEVVRVSDSAVMEVSTSKASNIFTFSGTTLADATAYRVVTDSDGASYNAQYVNTPGSYPYTDANISITSGTYDSAGSTWNIRNVISSVASDLIVQTNAQAIDADPTSHQLYTGYTGAGAVTYDISFDGGTTWVTDQPLNTKNSSVHAGSSMIMKINLDTAPLSLNSYAVTLDY